MSEQLDRSFMFVLTDGGGTVPPELGVVRRLVERGHRVAVLVEESMADAGRSTGAIIRLSAPNGIGPPMDWALRTPASLARDMVEHMIAGPAPLLAADTAAALDELRPDIVLTSFLAVGAMIAAESRGTPFDVLMPNIYSLPASGMPPIGMGATPARGAGGKLRDKVATAGTTGLLNRYGLKRINALRRQYGLSPISSLWDQARHAGRQLVLTSQSFDFPAALPPNARYVGPILDDPSWADSQWMPPQGQAPLVLVALSSTFQNQAACLQRIADALGTLPVRGLITTGPALAPEAIKAPQNVQVLSAAPHSQVLAHTMAVVTHGGHGTVIKTLVAGLPMVVLHHGRDQADNAVRVTARGAGVAMSRRAPASKIAKAVEKVLATSSYREAAARLGRAIAADAAGSALLDELEREMVPGPTN